MKWKVLFWICCFSTSTTALDGQANDDKLSVCLVENGLTALGLPYVSGTLERGNDSSAIWFADKFDCVTFVEWVLALSLYQTQSIQPTKDFESILETIRYRIGIASGYTSRLHYFTEWISQAVSSGFLIDITQELGGKEVSRNIDFMTQNRSKYPKLKLPQNYVAIQKTEKQLSNTTYFELPKNLVESAEKNINEGDIIAITTTIKGLDITHTGIAIRRNDKIHLLHASSDEMKVVVTDKPLHFYLKQYPKMKGIRVLRPINPFK
ncbi:MAG: DUF1460 domain-containing protein [Saprospiraceae bacterium]|nr:DUF1460 domain-containing protein [Saprospiraceae bacterium]